MCELEYIHCGARSARDSVSVCIPFRCESKCLVIFRRWVSVVSVVVGNGLGFLGN